MTVSWSPEQLLRLDAAEELQIAPGPQDGPEGPDWVRVWVVTVDEQVFVRTWYRRTTGWFGCAVEYASARVRVPGVEAEVALEDLGDADGNLLDRVDAAYRTKYAGYGDGAVGPMVSDRARATTLRLTSL